MIGVDALIFSGFVFFIMNQNIKLRIWHKTENKMIEWEDIIASAFNHYISKETTSLLYPILTKQMDNINTMSFTNKSDVDGKEIYVGDIVEITINHGNFKLTKLRYLIVFHQDGFQGCNLIKKYKVNYLNQEVLYVPKRFNYKEWDSMKVIGNMYHNKEMLKGIFTEESEVYNG